MPESGSDEFASAPHSRAGGLSAAQKLAWAALVEITPADTIGAPAGQVEESDGVISYLFENTMAGYPGWKWTVTVAQVDGSEPTVLETELMPADGALLAPDWVPWSDRMDDYRAAQLALGEAADAELNGELDSDLDEGADDVELDDDLDDDDLDVDDVDLDGRRGRSVVHSGDVDGVDIDELDEPLQSDELAVPVVGVDESDEAEPEAGGADEQPPAVRARRQWGRKRKQKD